MKTKRFLLATSGATVDGRTIDADMLIQMADSYDPKTYSARLNIEHIRGVSGDGAFKAYGDVLSLETEKVTVNFNGEDEERTGLYGIFDVTDDAKALNDSGQKLYPSVEINTNFAGKEFAYLMGCALTDSPASIATDRLEFNRSLPGALTVATDAKELAFALELEGEGADPADGAGLLGKFSTVLDNFAAKFAPASETPPAKEPETPEGGALDFSQLQPLFTDLTKAIGDEIGEFRSEVRSDIDQFGVKIKAIETQLDGTPAENHTARPPAAGKHGQRFKADY